ncbi:hypothetical protein ACS3SW_10465 [Roseobacteraceae bacterium S113]
MNTKTLTAGALTGLLVMSLTLGPVAAQTAATTTGLSEADAVAIALGEVHWRSPRGRA